MTRMMVPALPSSVARTVDANLRRSCCRHASVDSTIAYAQSRGAMMTGDPARRESRIDPANRTPSNRQAIRRARAAFLIAMCSLPADRVAAESSDVSDDWIMTTVHRHCAMCHSENPSHTTLLGQPPPKGVVLESIEDVRRFAPRIMEMVVRRKVMPFGNETAMTDTDRIRFGQWIAAQDPPPPQR